MMKMVMEKEMDDNDEEDKSDTLDECVACSRTWCYEEEWGCDSVSY